MKKIIPFFLLLILSASSFSQQTNPAPALTKQDYLEKSKKQKTGAWLLLSGGFVMSTIGAGLAIDDAADETSGALVTLLSLGLVEPVSDDKDNTAVANVLFFTGLAGMIGSIPLFKAAEKSKRKGMSLSFSNQKIPSLQKSSFVYNSIPSLKLKINL
jgi:energy-converting hydrogenase Eha subunit H